MDDLTELLTRISEFSWAYRDRYYKQPLFRLTPSEHKLLKEHLINSGYFYPEYYGHLPHYLGADFELVGAPILLSGAHIRGDSGVEINEVRSKR